jgi:hypothetical protein
MTNMIVNEKQNISQVIQMAPLRWVLKWHASKCSKSSENQLEKNIVKVNKILNINNEGETVKVLKAK